MPKRTTGHRPELKLVNVGAAAIDIGSKMHMAAVNPTCTDTPVRTFGTFTEDLHHLADWFKASGVTSVAMESTGVHWIPVYEILEQRGFEVILVNARYAKNVPGRKSDVSDAACCASFIPTVCYAAASDLMPRLQPCAPICASGSGWWDMPLPISSICRRP
ncbi:transposase [Bradyrhizobium yuanmingense]|nr:transposase [Bradyrhizobium yuanmingense]MDF0522687.1 transposase [Bradyrhizobium yuanmingense]